MEGEETQVRSSWLQVKLEDGRAREGRHGIVGEQLLRNNLVKEMRAEAFREMAGEKKVAQFDILRSKDVVVLIRVGMSA